MTNDDLKRFYGINELPQENKDFVRYDKDGRIKSKNPIKSNDVVTLDYFNNHGGGGGGDTGVNTINSLNLTVGEEIITYDTTDGLTIASTSEIQYGDSNKHQFDSEINIPLIGENGITIDSNEQTNKLIIKNEYTPAQKLNNPSNLEAVYAIENNGDKQKMITVSNEDSNETLIQRGIDGKAQVATADESDNPKTIANIGYVANHTKGNIKTLVYDNTTLADHFSEILSYVNNENGGSLIDIGFKIGQNNIEGLRKTVTLDTTTNTLTTTEATGNIMNAGEFLYARPTTLMITNGKTKITFITTNDIEIYSCANITLNNTSGSNAATMCGQEFGYLPNSIVNIYFNNINILNVELEHLVINYYTI